MNNDVRKREISEAISAGETALRSLNKAKEALSSARNWGLFDLFGGGLVTDLIKHSKLNNATEYMEDAKLQLKKFKKELGDVTVHSDMQLNISGFLSFADFFFDGIIADYLVQTRIADARSQIDEAILQVSTILDSLHTLT